MAKKKAVKKEAAPKKERTPREVKKLPVPAKFQKMALGACIDQIYKWEKEIEAATKALSEKLAPTVLNIKMMRQHVTDSFKVAELNGAKGKISQSEIKQVEVPSVVDWDKVYEYIAENEAWGLLHKRISTEAWRERLNAKDPVPGIDPFTVTTLSVKKR